MFLLLDIFEKKTTLKHSSKLFWILLDFFKKTTTLLGGDLKWKKENRYGVYFLKVAPRHVEADNTFCLVKKWCFHSGFCPFLISTFFAIWKAGNTQIFSKMFIFIPEYLKKYFMYSNKLKRFWKLIYSSLYCFLQNSNIFISLGVILI